MTGFDQTAYVAAVSSNMFNVVAPVHFDGLLNAFKDRNPGGGSEFLSARIPNPFKGSLPGIYIDSTEGVLTLVDGGQDGQGIPFQPLLVKARSVDVIIATDAVRHDCYIGSPRMLNDMTDLPAH